MPECTRMYPNVPELPSLMCPNYPKEPPENIPRKPNSLHIALKCRTSSFKLQPGLCLLPFALAFVVAPTWPLPFALRSLACSQSQVSSSNLAFACCPLLLRWWPVESCRPWRSSDQVSSTNPAFAICPGSSKLIFTRCDLSIGLHLTAHFLFRLAA